MTKRELVRGLKSAVDGSSFITLTELTKYLGLKDKYKVRRKYLLGLNSIGKRYFIDDVADELLKHMN